MCPCMASAIVTARQQHTANPDPIITTGAALASSSSSQPLASNTHQRSFSSIPPPTLTTAGRSSSFDAAGRDFAMSQPQSQPSSQQSFAMSQPQSQSQFSRHQLPDHPRGNARDQPPRIIYSVRPKSSAFLVIPVQLLILTL